MKKLLFALLCTTMLFGLTACSDTAQESSPISTSSSTASVQSNDSTTSIAENSKIPKNSSAPESSVTLSTSSAATSDAQPSAESSKALVVYFSMPETTKADNLTAEEENSVVVIGGEVLGNTQYVATVIAENTDADIFRIEAKTPYTTDHEALINLAKEEQNNTARPALAANVENLNQYDTVFIGYPNWWGDMPMILYTFFDENDFSGKTIIPFNTHGGSGFSGTISTIAELEPNADVNQEGFTVSRNNVQDSESDIISWIAGLGYGK